MKLSDLELDMVLDYKNNSPLELIAEHTIDVDANDYILLSIMLKRENKNEYLEELLHFLDEIRMNLLNKENSQLTVQAETESFYFEADYYENVSPIQNIDPTESRPAEYLLNDWYITGEETLPLSVQGFLKWKINNIINK